MADNIDIKQAAADPKSVLIDGERVEQHSLAEQIEADKYLRSLAARKKKRLPFQQLAVRPPGAVF
ncbi:MAG: hypothetical protein WCV67_03055 [Victivallaceae bacterium]|jgi:hypothetical protein